MIQRVPRDATLRGALPIGRLAEIPRLLGAIDRNPYRPTYGCLDRQYWHYRTSSFPSQMYQEGALALAMVVRLPLPGNRWHADPRVRELAVAALRFSARSSHADGSCDDYYPFERALGAAVFSLQAAARALRVARPGRPGDPRLAPPPGRLAHQAPGIGTVGQSPRLGRFGAAPRRPGHRAAAVSGGGPRSGWAGPPMAVGRRLVRRYTAAPIPGYQTLTIDCLAKYRQATGDHRLDEPLRRAVDFARHFLHADQSYGGEYGSRGSYHFYPHGMELLAADHSAAADLADGFLMSLRTGTCAHFADDRMFAHRLANLIEAYIDWAAQRAVAASGVGGLGLGVGSDVDRAAQPAVVRSSSGSRYFPQAQILVVRDAGLQTVVSAAGAASSSISAPVRRSPTPACWWKRPAAGWQPRNGTTSAAR